MRHPALALVALAGIVVASPTPALAQTAEHPTILQWFELEWDDMENRIPDFFLAGYGAVWLPPISKANSPESPGYDAFARFDLGSPGNETAYGTFDGFRAVVDELHAANGLIYIDSIMNHNSGRDGSVSFQEKGGYPGFWLNSEDPPETKFIGDDWGDFHDGTATDEVNGDLLGLIDIAQEFDNQFIRHPVQEGDPDNIPAGTIFNKPRESNYALYPDTDLTPQVFFNPGTPNNPGATQFTIFPYNTDDLMQGDPVLENSTDLLTRWTRWCLEVLEVDGFRLDAAKHAPTFFWDTFWDASVYLRRRTPAGSLVTPFSFVESVSSNDFTFNNYTRKGDGFGNRDALDVAGAGQLRDISNAAGFGSWQSVLASHIDNADDGLNNGSLGVNHVFSHDNGTKGDGTSLPPLPTIREQALASTAYALLRPGPPIIYHNTRGITDRPFGFFPREGYSIALGWEPITQTPEPAITDLVRIKNEFARGDWDILNFTEPNNPSLGDVIVFERVNNDLSVANLLVGVNDRYDSGVEFRDVLTDFPAGTRLQELTGNAADPVVDPFDLIPETLVVGGDQRVIIAIPNNVSSQGEHNRGYVAYGPTIPSGALEITPLDGEIPASPASFPDWAQRLNAVPVVTADTFDITLTTTQTDPLDPNTDEDAAFKIDQGFVDYNGNGSVDFPEFGTPTPGFETFTDVNQPLFGSGNDEGLYSQTIDATQLADGYHYLTVVAFRHRPSGGDPIFAEFREVIYLDRVGPPVEWLNADEPIEDDTHLFKVGLLDRTATRVHFLLDVPDGADPVELADSENQGFEHDRFEWRKTLVGLTPGPHELTLVAFEVTENASVTTFDIFVGTCQADFNQDGDLNILDFIAFQAAFAAMDEAADANGDGEFNILDFITFQGLFQLGCE